MTERYSEIKSLINKAISLLEEEMTQTKKEMEDSFNKVKESMIQEIKEKDAEIESLKKELDSYAKQQKKTKVENKESKAVLPSEPQDSLFSQDIFSSEQNSEQVSLPEPKEELIADSNVEQDEEEDFFTFDDDDSQMFEIIVKDDNRKSPILGELFSSKGIIGENGNSLPRWRTDRPGVKVEKLEQAISLNDRVYFIRELFRGDSEQFELTLERIEDYASFDEVVSEIRITFPEWDEASDAVYRFYMAVRRKF